MKDSQKNREHSLLSGLTAAAAGGIVGLLEAVWLQGPIAWWSRDADRSLYFFAFVAYGFAIWLLLFLLRMLKLRIPTFRSRVVVLLGGLSLILAALYATVPSYRFLRSTSTANADAEKVRALKRHKPNIILITLDTTRADHLGCYGYERPTSPFLDSVASRGVLFEQAYTTATWTLPSHASMFTGMMPAVHGAGYSNFFLGPSLQTLAEQLDARGYQSAGFIGGPFLVSAFNIHQGFHFYDEQLDPHSKLKRLALFRAIAFALRRPLWTTDGQRRAEEINNKLFPYLDSLKDGRPFFLFVNYFDPHEPYDPPDAARRELNVQTNVTGHIRNYFIDKETGEAQHRDRSPLTEEEFRQIRSLYDAEIRYLDGELKRLWDKLQSSGLLKNTIVVITSDHGESIGEHKFLDHGHTLYQEQLRIPLIIAGGPWDRALRIQTPVQTTDIFATLMQQTGGVPPGIQGRSLLPVLSNHELPLRPVLAELDEDPHPRYKAFRRSLRAIVRNNDKLLDSSNNKPEFYDLASDPLELQNRIQEDAAKAAELRKEMNDHFRLFIAMRQAGKGEIDEETRERLRSLGYIE